MCMSSVGPNEIDSPTKQVSESDRTAFMVWLFSIKAAQREKSSKKDLRGHTLIQPVFILGDISLLNFKIVKKRLHR